LHPINWFVKLVGKEEYLMITIGAFEAKTHLSALLEKVAQGEEVIITRRGRPVARLVPEKGQQRLERREVIQRLQSLAARQRLNGLDWKELRDEGRK
jgi:prevent-host-death family protein